MRPFRRPPHTGFVTASYRHKEWAAALNAAFASRRDDPTFLYFMDADQANSLLLPNRNLDHGYAKVDVSGSYELCPWVSVYAQVDNLLSQQHIAPIGYLSLPFNYRVGLRFALGREGK